MNNIKFAIFFAVIIGCKESSSISTEYLFLKIDSKIEKVFESGEDEISISKLTPFDWDLLYIFKPYTTTKQINEELGFDWIKSNDSEKSIDNEDSFCLLVFSNKKNVVSYIKWPRNKGDFSKVNKIKYLSNEANFFIKKEKFGDQDWYFFYNNN